MRRGPTYHDRARSSLLGVAFVMLEAVRQPGLEDAQPMSRCPQDAELALQRDCIDLGMRKSNPESVPAGARPG
jgi:hypothetical protein